MRSHTNRARLLALALFLGALAFVDDHVFAETARLETGDLVFQRSRSGQSEAVAAATGSEYTHMGLVLERDGRTMVLEASSTVRLTPYDAFVARGIDGEVVVKRLRDGHARLDAASRARIRAEGRRLVGTPYDTRFEWSNDAMYCSELVYKVLERSIGVRVGALAPAGSFDLEHPAVRQLMARRFRRNALREEEPVISPAAMFDDPALETILAR